MTTMLETLNETAAAYTSKTRAVDPRNTGPRYFVITSGRCCAIGRCMTNPEKHKNFTGGVARFGHLDLMLKPAYRGFSIDFWLDIQDLHDWEDNWNEKGLTRSGKAKVIAIKKAHGL